MKRFAYIILTAIVTLAACSTYDYESILEQGERAIADFGSQETDIYW